MRASTYARRAVLLVAITAIVAGCAVPEESGPNDLNKDKDRNGLPDDAERNMTNMTDPTPPPTGAQGVPVQPTA